MSVKQGSKFIAGNLALRVQDRLFTALRTLEGSQEYYDVIVPVGATLGFTEGTRLMVIVEGTNTTTTPILRYGATQFYIVSSRVGSFEVNPGDLPNDYLLDMFIKDLSTVKPGTSTPLIYLGRREEDYGNLANRPSFRGRNNEIHSLLPGPNSYTTLGLPYIEGNNLIVNDLDLLDIQLNEIKYGKEDFSYDHILRSTNRIKWQKSGSEILELATVRDVQEITIADQFVDVLVYSRNTIDDMNNIDDMVTGDTCLVLENNTIYIWDNEWDIQEVLDFNLTTDNGKYFDIEDIDSENSGKAIWNVSEGGRFRVFANYSSSIDGITIIRNSSRALEVAKVPNELTINNLDANGDISDSITFDGSSPKTFTVTVDFSKYYSKLDIDSQYNEATPGHIAKFFTEGENVKIQDGGVVAADIVTKTSSGTFLQAQGSNVNASMIAFEEGSIEDFLDQDFTFSNIENDFIAGQKIAGELIATRDWTQNTFLPNTFDLNLVTNAAIQLNSPSAGKTSLRFARTNPSTGATNNLDVELPVVSESNNGLVTPAQVTAWNTINNKVDKEKITGSLTSKIDYTDGVPGLLSNYVDRRAEISILDDGSTNGFRASLLSINITDNLYSGIITDKTGVYAFNNEVLSKDNAHRVATQGYIEQNVVLQDDIVTDLNGQWDGKKVVLGAFNFITLGASSATYRQYGSNVATGLPVNYDRAFPIVNETLAGLATAGLFNQVADNTSAIANLQGQGQVGVELPQPPSQSDIQEAWDTAKPTIPSVEGSTVVDLITGNSWRLLDVAGTLTWVNLGVLGGTGQATNATTGVVKGSPSGSGTIFVENDATMVVNGWDDVLSDTEKIDLGLTSLESAYDGHIIDINFGNRAPHVLTTDRTNWDGAKTTADAAIPKVPAAVNNNLVMWSTGGVLKDSLLQVVTGFTTPTDLQIPTAKAVNDIFAKNVDVLKLTGNQTAAGNKTFTGEMVLDNNSILKLLEIKNQGTASYARMMFTGNAKQFTLGVGNSNAAITELRNKFYAYDFTTSTPIMYGDQSKMKFSGTVGVANAVANDDAVNLGQLNDIVPASSSGGLIHKRSITPIIKSSNMFSKKTWTGLTNISGARIWTDGVKIYYSYNTNQYQLDPSSSTWSVKTWTGLTDFNGSYVWTDGVNIYYSRTTNQYQLDPSTSTWTVKTWTGLTNFNGSGIWTDGVNIYYSSTTNQYQLDPSSSTWSAKTWTGLTNFNGSGIWTDGVNIYYSSNTNQYQLDPSSSTWSAKTWTGLTDFYGSYVWTDGVNIYYSSSTNQYQLDSSTSTWTVKTWTGLTNISGNNVWTDGVNIYYSTSTSQYQLNYTPRMK